MQTTRLHISGLTPAISANDLRQRFSTFGDVRGVDGVGKVDGVGRPRKFAYVTLETTQPKLARCMNLLSGSTWKGAKLRIGEAKPDYLARHELEVNPPPPAPRPKLDPLARRRARLKFRLRARRLARGTQGRHAKDMTPITLNTVSKHKGWRRTPLDHLIRPMRMRPLRPLPPTISKLRAQPKSKTKLKLREKKKKWELTRARCTVIDPARYGAVHLMGEGGLLGAEVLVGQEGQEVVEPEVQEDVDVESEESEESEAEEETPPPAPEPKLSTTKTKTPPLVQPPILTQPAQLPTSSHPTDPALISLVQEKADTLALLGGMFGEGEWEGRESVSGDEGDVRDGMDVEGEEGYEVVPGDREKPAEKLQESEDENMVEEEVEDASDDAGVEVEVEMEEQDEVEEQVENTAAQQNYNSLKDMFKPQEDTGGFSLGLDIELDPDAESFLPASIQPEPVPETVLQPTAPATIQNRTIQFTPDPKAMFFFPGVGKQDVFGVISERGWEWPHPGTSEEIRAKWDKDKAELTREYTRRHREAVKRKRRGGGGRGDEI